MLVASCALVDDLIEPRGLEHRTNRTQRNVLAKLYHGDRLGVDAARAQAQHVFTSLEHIGTGLLVE